MLYVFIYLIVAYEEAKLSEKLHLLNEFRHEPAETKCTEILLIYSFFFPVIVHLLELLIASRSYGKSIIRQGEKVYLYMMKRKVEEDRLIMIRIG